MDSYNALNDPGFPIPAMATAIHGITDQMVKGKALDLSRLWSLLEAADFVVAHNAAFDRGFLERLHPAAERLSWRCSMNQVPWGRFGQPSKALQRLLAAHGISPGNAHRALDDVVCALALLSCSGPYGEPYLKCLIDAGPSPRHREDEGHAGGNLASTWLHSDSGLNDCPRRR